MHSFEIVSPSTLLLRIILCLPKELWDVQLITASVADTIAAVAKDEVLSLLLPGIRAAMLPVLEKLRPDVLSVLKAADEAEISALEASSIENEVRQAAKSIQAVQISPVPFLQL